MEMVGSPDIAKENKKAQEAGPRFSLLHAGVGMRLFLAGLISGILWGVIAWALT